MSAETLSVLLHLHAAKLIAKVVEKLSTMTALSLFLLTLTLKLLISRSGDTGNLWVKLGSLKINILSLCRKIKGNWWRSFQLIFITSVRRKWWRKFIRIKMFRLSVEKMPKIFIQRWRRTITAALWHYHQPSGKSSDSQGFHHWPMQNWRWFH